MERLDHSGPRHLMAMSPSLNLHRRTPVRYNPPAGHGIGWPVRRLRKELAVLVLRTVLGRRRHGTVRIARQSARERWGALEERDVG